MSVEAQRTHVLEPRVAVLESKVSNIEAGLVTLTGEIAVNNKLTADIKENTDALVKASQAVAWLIKVFGVLGVIATGVAGAIYIAQHIAALMHP